MSDPVTAPAEQPARDKYSVEVSFVLADGGTLKAAMKDGSREEAQALLDFVAAQFTQRTTEGKPGV